MVNDNRKSKELLLLDPITRKNIWDSRRSGDRRTGGPGLIVETYRDFVKPRYYNLAETGSRESIENDELLQSCVAGSIDISNEAFDPRYFFPKKDKRLDWGRLSLAINPLGRLTDGLGNFLYGFQTPKTSNEKRVAELIGRDSYSKDLSEQRIDEIISNLLGHPEEVDMYLLDKQPANIYLARVEGKESLGGIFGLYAVHPEDGELEMNVGKWGSTIINRGPSFYADVMEYTPELWRNLGDGRFSSENGYYSDSEGKNIILSKIGELMLPRIVFDKSLARLVMDKKIHIPRDSLVFNPLDLERWEDSKEIFERSKVGD